MLKALIVFALISLLNKGLPGPLLTYLSVVIDTIKKSPFVLALSKCFIWPKCNKSKTP